MKKVSAEIIKHSPSVPGQKNDLISVKIIAPKFLDAEFEKHGTIASNSSSDRAIPVTRTTADNPYLPHDVRLNQRGMQGYEVMSDDEVAKFHQDLIELFGYTKKLIARWNHVHKQHLNRYLIGFSWQTKLLTSHDWENFMRLRLHHTADPNMIFVAQLIKNAIDGSKPTTTKLNGYTVHLPFVHDGEILSINDIEKLCQLSTARSCRVSYDRLDGSKSDFEGDVERFHLLMTRPYTSKRGEVFEKDDPIHATPAEHACVAMTHDPEQDFFPNAWTHTYKDGSRASGRFVGWLQYRKEIEGRQYD